MVYRLRKIWNPGIFQGHNRKDHYFEGWYYKMVDKNGKNVLAVIPGLARNEPSEDSHSFIQVLNGVSGAVQYHRFHVNEFSASKSEHDVRVGQNRFRPGSIELNLDDKEGSLNGMLSFKALTPWPVTLLRPGYMGWYAFVPFMECYHGVLSFDHAVSGALTLNGKNIDFAGGRGYMEKDWGVSFPRSWIWMQSNHFEQAGVSFVMSIATIPWLGNYFTGFGGAFWNNGAFFPFTTWNGSRVKNLHIKEEETSFTVEHRKYRIGVRARGRDTGELLSPVFGEMAGKVLESMKAQITLQFSVKEGKSFREVFSGTGSFGGLEIMGNPDELRKGLS